MCVGADFVVLRCRSATCARRRLPSCCTDVRTARSCFRLLLIADRRTGPVASAAPALCAVPAVERSRFRRIACRADDLRDGAAAGADLPRARHDLHRRRHADRGRRHGRRRRAVLAMMKRRLTWDLMRQATESTAKLSAFVVFILIGARVFSLTFYGVRRPSLGRGTAGRRCRAAQIGFLIFVNIFVFVLAFFLDFFEIAFIVIPLLGPAGGAARHRPDLVRRHPRREHADVVHASALRICAVLSALGRAARGVHRPGHRQAHGAGHHRADLLGRGAVRGHPVHHGRPRHRLPGDGDALQGHRHRRWIRPRSRSRSSSPICRRSTWRPPKFAARASQTRVKKAPDESSGAFACNSRATVSAARARCGS